MKSPFRIAFLGIDHPHGAGWRESLANFGGEIEISALVPGFNGGTASLEERHAGLPRFDDVDALMAKGKFDGAIICLPNNRSAEVAAKLAQAGKHIMIEKPTAGSAKDFQDVFDAVSLSKVAFQTGFMWRYDEGANRLKDMVDDGRFGKIINVEITSVTSDVNRRGADHYLFNREASGGGYFNWLACHYLDLLFYVTGETIVGVTARTGVFGTAPVEVEDGGAAILDLSGGGIAVYTGGYWLPRWTGESRWTVRGSERWVHWEPSRRVEIHGPQPQFYAMEETVELRPDKTPGYSGTRGVDLIRDWIDAARSGTGSCRNTPKSTYSTLELLDAIGRSSREGRRIECEIGG